MDWQTALETARSNKISPRAFKDRIRIGWSLERAATEPIRGSRNPLKIRTTPELRALAERNGVSYKTLYSRLSLGWDGLRAATTVPIIPKLRRAYKRDRIPEEWVEAAKANGVAYCTLYYRLLKGWDVAIAISLPPCKGKFSKSKYCEVRGKALPQTPKSAPRQKTPKSAPRQKTPKSAPRRKRKRSNDSSKVKLRERFGL